MDFKSYLAVIVAGVFASATAYGAGAPEERDGIQSRAVEQGQQADVQADISEDGVRQLQEQLKAEGYYEDGEVDGIWGPKTQQAVSNFQQDQGLDSTGQLNAETVEAMGLEDRAEFAQFVEEQQQEQDGAMQQDPGADIGEQPGAQEDEGISPDRDGM